MICPKCGTQNEENVKFCMRCGNSFNNVQNVNDVNNYKPPIETIGDDVVEVINNNENNSLNIQNNNTNSQEVPVNNNYVNEKIPISKYFFIILGVILKPFTTFKEEIKKFDELKNSLFMSLIISVVVTIISLIKSMYNVVRVTSLFDGKTKWVWKNLGNLKYFKLIMTDFLIYAGIIFGIACIFYIVSLILKKQPSFSRILGISAVSIVPLFASLVVLSPILSSIYTPLGMIISIAGLAYTMILLYEIMNNEIGLEGNFKIYFNLICFSIILVALYYLYMKMFSVTISNKLTEALKSLDY